MRYCNKNRPCGIKLSGVKQKSFIARLENNRMDPQLTTVLKILKPLGLTLSVTHLPQVDLGREAMVHQEKRT